MNDVIITGSNSTKINDFIHLLNTRFALKDMDTFPYYLGIDVSKLTNNYLK